MEIIKKPRLRQISEKQGIGRIRKERSDITFWVKEKLEGEGREGIGLMSERKFQA